MPFFVIRVPEIQISNVKSDGVNDIVLVLLWYCKSTLYGNGKPCRLLLPRRFSSIAAHSYPSRVSASIPLPAPVFNQPLSILPISLANGIFPSAGVTCALAGFCMTRDDASSVATPSAAPNDDVLIHDSQESSNQVYIV